jgi:hypothetical protein
MTSHGRRCGWKNNQYRGDQIARSLRGLPEGRATRSTLNCGEAMEDVTRLCRQADRCFELARTASDPDTRKQLEVFGRELERRAAEIAEPKARSPERLLTSARRES